MKLNLINFLNNYQQYNNKNYNSIYFNIDNKEETINLLEDFCKSNNLVEYKYAWEILIDKIPIEYFTEKITDFLIENEIELISLAHESSLPENTLLKIYEKDKNCVEAIDTVGLSYLEDINCTNDVFFEFIKKYKNPKFYSSLIYSLIHYVEISTNEYEKSMLLCDFIINNFKKSHWIYKEATDLLKYFELINTSDEKILINASKRNNHFELIALTQNPKTPKKALSNILIKKSDDYWIKNIQYICKILIKIKNDDDN